METYEKSYRVLYLDLDGTVRHGFDELGRFVNKPEDVTVFSGSSVHLAALPRCRVEDRWNHKSRRNRSGASEFLRLPGRNYGNAEAERKRL